MKKKLDATLWAGVGLYFLTIAIAYYFAGGEPVGLVANIGCSVAGGLVAGWLYRDRYPVETDDPEEGEPAEGGVPVGVFPSASVRPLGLAFGLTLAVAGIPLGSWMVVAGAAIVASQVGLMIRDQDA